MFGSMTPLSRNEAQPPPNGEELLEFLNFEHRRLLALAGSLRQEDNGAGSKDGSLRKLRSDLVSHFSMKDRILFPAIRKISCPSAWGILEETVRRHRQIRIELDQLESPSGKEGRHLERLALLSHLLAESFADEERRLLDEARRHLSRAELCLLARGMSEWSEPLR